MSKRTNETRNEENNEDDFDINKHGKRHKKYTKEHYVPVFDPMEEIMDGSTPQKKYFQLKNIPEDNQREDFEQLTFNEWNAKMEAWERIYAPSTFDTDPVPDGKIEFGEIKRDQEYTAKDGSKGTYSFTDISTDRNGKKVKGFTLRGPSVVSNFGYCVLKEGQPKCIPFKLYLENPHHVHFMEVTYRSFSRHLYEFIMLNMGMSGKTKKSLSKAEVEGRSSDKYKEYFKSIDESFVNFFKFPKNGEELELDANYRRCVLNPSNIEAKGEKKEFKTSVYLCSGKGREKITLEQLELICEGWENTGEKDDKGEFIYVKGKRKALEFSFDLQFSRLTCAKEANAKVTLTAMYITDIFESPDISRADDKRAQEIASSENLANVDLSQFAGLKFKGETEDKGQKFSRTSKFTDSDDENEEREREEREERRRKRKEEKERKQDSEDEDKKKKSKKDDDRTVVEKSSKSKKKQEDEDRSVADELREKRKSKSKKDRDDDTIATEVTEKKKSKSRKDRDDETVVTKDEDETIYDDESVAITTTKSSSKSKAAVVGSDDDETVASERKKSKGRKAKRSKDSDEDSD